MTKKLYTLGYYANTFISIDYEKISTVKQYANLCQKFVIGIPDTSIVARLFGDKSGYVPEKVQAFLLELNWVDECIILDDDMLLYQNAYHKLHFDLCFYGSEYGKKFIDDSIFMKQHDVIFVSQLPAKIYQLPKEDSLDIALNNIRKEHKIILFGVEKYIKIYMKRYGESHKPSYAITTTPEKWGTHIQSIPVFSPERLSAESIDDTLIIICEENYIKIKESLLLLGNYNYRLLIYDNNMAILEEFAIARANEKAYLEKVHKLLLNMLAEFDRVCMKYNLHYYLTCGSLIGAVRHKGFIPWDDDVDLAMPRTDFNRLKEIALKEWHNTDYQLIDFYELGNNAFMDWIPRFIYYGDHVPNKAFDKISEKAAIDIKDRPFLDIYPLDPASDNKNKHLRYATRLKILYNLFMGHRAYIDYNEYKNVPSKTLLLMKILHKIGRYIPFNLLVHRYKKLSNYARNENGNCFFRTSISITRIERTIHKDLFGEGKRTEFEDITVMIPSDPDGVLCAQRYKNYMTPAKESKRKPSHYYNSTITTWSHI